MWVASQGWLVGYLPAPEVLLAPAAAGLALAAAMGMAAFEVDLPDYHFGWPQIASVLAGAALVIAVVPFVQSTADGSWDLTSGDFSSMLGAIPSPNSSYRTLWIGDASVMPLTGWPLPASAIDEPGPGHQLVYGTVDGSTSPSVQNLYPGADGGATAHLTDALLAASHGQTSRLGALLAPMGIEYIVVPSRLAPPPYANVDQSSPTALLDMLSGQLDLSRVDLPAGIAVFRNAAWGPVTASLPRDAHIPDGSGALAERTLPALTGAPDALPNVNGYAS